MTSGVYVIECGEGLYVGSSKDIKQRWGMHRHDLRSGIHHARSLQGAWAEYGEGAFTFRIVEECPPEQCLERERYWIDQLAPMYNTKAIARPPVSVRRSDEAPMKAPALSPEGAARLEVAQALADEVRLTVLMHLMDGPATVSELAGATGATQNNLSNHLALLRERRLVRAERQGRQQVYTIRDAAVGGLIESLQRTAGRTRSEAATTHEASAIAQARTCYDHLAGQLGVAIFDALTARGALIRTEICPDASGRAGTASVVALGPAAAEVFGALGISPQAARQTRRRFATACLDWTERRPHLGGALGAALWARAVAAGWVVREPGSRAVIVTDTGHAALRAGLGVEM